LFKLGSAIVITAVTAAVFVVSAFAQAPRGSQSRAAGPSSRPPQTFPAPTNLKVLPKDLTGRQVHDIMERWSGELGVRCSACHVRDSEAVVPGGPLHPRFADDSKPMKGIARIMYAMTAEINHNFISTLEETPKPVTCGTCHRGAIRPEPFVAPADGQQSVTPIPFPAWAPSSK
jgi:Photosynthetic reaction centre cytochrome C subunit